MSDLQLSIIIPSFNTQAILKNCLDSILGNTKDISYEIIVIENGSTDGSLKMLQSYSQKTKVLKVINVKENLGFGKANNLGASNAKGDYLLFLNSDTLIFDNSLKACLQNLKQHPNVGVYSCRLLNTDKTTQESGGHFPSLFNLFAWQFGIDDLPIIGNLIPSFHPQKSQHDLNKKMDWVTGAFMIIPKNIFNDVNGFDEKIFMYTEEMELAYRITKLGYKTLNQNSPAIIHLGKASGGSELAITSEVDNMLYFWQKHMPAWQVPLVKFAFFFGSLLRLILFGIIKQDEKYKRAYLKALKLSL